MTSLLSSQPEKLGYVAFVGCCFQRGIINRVTHNGSCAGWVKERTDVRLFLTIKNQITNENAGGYLSMQDAGQRVQMLCRTRPDVTPGHPRREASVDLEKR